MNELTQINTKYFELTPTSLKISEDTPLDEWKKAGLFLKQAEGAIQFWIGDWINFGEKKYGKIKELSEEQSDYSYGTLRDFASVAGRLSSRNDNLSFKHHKTVSPLEPPQQKEWLDKAEKNDWSVSELRHNIRLEQAKDFKPLPNGKYTIIYADPPWQYWEGGEKNQSNHYSTMTMEQIKNLPVGELAADDCILFLWVTFPILKECFDVIESWGFSYSTGGFVWVKKNKISDSFFFGNGGWTRANTEFCLIATKGSPKRIDASISQIICSPIEEHSKKPDIVREKIVQLIGDVPRIELFARNQSEGWSVWGNEV